MADDDIVQHTDILSSPSQARGKVICRVVSNKKSTVTAEGSDRRARSPKKSLLERIELSQLPESIFSQDSDTSPLVSPVGKKKRGRPRKTPVKKTVNTTAAGDSDNEILSNDSEYAPETKRLRRDSSLPAPSTAASASYADLSKPIEQTPATPSRDKTPKKTLSTEHNFTSPLKKVILSNLDEYKNTASIENLKLSRNFIPTPVPTAKSRYSGSAEKSTTSFFDTFEGYFDQRKQPRGSQKSKNTMSMATEVTRDEFALISNLFHHKLHRAARNRLYEIQSRLFPQYWFELTQGFSLLFYGVGSKREFLEKYVFDYLIPHLAQDDQEEYGVPCVVINGYNPTCNYRDVFKDISKALLPQELNRNETKYWGNHVLLQIQKMIELYRNEPSDIKLVIMVHNLDGPSLRKDTFQIMLCYLALIRQVAIVASTDHIYAPILWDNFKAQNYNFVFHDVSNYEPLAVESSFRDVMKMNRNDSASGAEGAKFVLESLTVNSKRMYKLLIETQISNMDAHTTNSKGKVPPTKRGSPTVGVEFKQLLHLCSADFIASNELSLRSMLTEFVEHKMAAISKNQAGTEHVWVPYNYMEMKKLLSTALQTI
ncbi:related to Origin recognition complex subunit 2 [Zygosaccharomyces bailii]|nr:related to Origin recognition complex subunit 2 [Zygosaccharomyces bailii]